MKHLLNNKLIMSPLLISTLSSLTHLFLTKLMIISSLSILK